MEVRDDEDRGPSRGERLLFGTLLCLILAGAAFVRMARARRGLPYLYEWDEPLIVSRALDMLKTGDLNPRAFEYGSLLVYLSLAVDHLHALWLQLSGLGPEGGAIDPRTIRTMADTGWLWSFSHPSFLLMNRWMMAAFGTATVGLVYLLGRRFAGAGAGLLAAAILAGLDYHVSQSAVVLPNAAVAFFAVLAVHLALRFSDSGLAAPLLAAAAASGLAASTKYNAAVVAIVPVAALLLYSWRPGATRRGRLWAGTILLPPILFFAGTPFALIDREAFLRDLTTQTREYFLSGHGEATVAPGLGHLWLQLGDLAGNLGAPAAVLAIAGLAQLLRARPGRLALLLPAGYLLYMAATRVSFHRNLVLVYPFAALAAGIAGAWLCRSASRVGRAAPVGAAVILAAIPLALFAESGPRGLEAWRGRDSRSRALDLAVDVARAAGAASRPIGIAEELRVHAEDVRRIEEPIEIVPLESLICDPPDRWSVQVLAPSYATTSRRSPADAALRQALVAASADPAAPAAASVGVESPFVLDGFVRDPLLILRRPGQGGAGARPECGPVLPGAQFRREEGDVSIVGTSLRLGQGGLAIGPGFLVEPGRYAFILRPAGEPPRAWRPSLAVTILAAGPGGETTSLAERTLTLGSETLSYMIEVTVDRSGVLFILLEFAEPPNPRHPWPQRAILVESARMIRLAEPGAAVLNMGRVSATQE